ncbi:MAG: ATP-binding protein [Kineosporiaceae bacterium]
MTAPLYYDQSCCNSSCSFRVTKPPKPSGLHDRDRHWSTLARFATTDEAGSALALVYGRRRQGKTLLLELLAREVGGLMFTGLRERRDLSLRRLAASYAGVTGGPEPRFDSWRGVLEILLGLGERRGGPAFVVLDEFPYLMEAEPSLPSLVQLALEPLSPARVAGRTRLVLCGSALHVMRGLLSGSAPLRGRAELEVLVHPFGFRQSAEFWGAPDFDTAFQVHALLGGTPAYRAMAGGPPDSRADLAEWVARGPLDPDRALFREGAILLQEEPGLHDLGLYHSTLTALSQGAHRPGEIATALGRPVTAVAHPLAVLEQTGLIARTEDAFRQRRPTYRVREPVIRLHQLVAAPNEAALVAGRAAEVWARVQDVVASRILGPHWEDLTRAWCLDHAGEASLGGVASRVQQAVVACPSHPGGHQLDVVVLEACPGERDRVIAVGESKGGTAAVDGELLARLDHVREILDRSGAAARPKLLLFARSGFTSELRRRADARDDVELVDLERLYLGS